MEKRKPKVNLTLKLDALFGDFAKWINNNIEALYERVDKLELFWTLSKGRRDKINIEESKSSNDEKVERRLRSRHGEVNPGSYVIKGIKMKILAFQGRSDLEAYLEWE